jgi:hypothetical protein
VNALRAARTSAQCNYGRGAIPRSTDHRSAGRPQQKKTTTQTTIRYRLGPASSPAASPPRSPTTSRPPTPAASPTTAPPPPPTGRRRPGSGAIRPILNAAPPGTSPAGSPPRTPPPNRHPADHDTTGRLRTRHALTGQTQIDAGSIPTRHTVAAPHPPATTPTPAIPGRPRRGLRIHESSTIATNRREVSAGMYVRRPRFGWAARSDAGGYPQSAY